MVSTKGKDDSQIQMVIKERLSEYISPYMMKTIKSNNINKEVTEDDIRKGYVSMIFDFVKAKRQAASSKSDI